MLENWIRPQRPEDDELKARLDASTYEIICIADEDQGAWITGACTFRRLGNCGKGQCAR